MSLAYMINRINLIKKPIFNSINIRAKIYTYQLIILRSKLAIIITPILTYQV
jgi:hypothetical protein